MIRLQGEIIIIRCGIFHSFITKINNLFGTYLKERCTFLELQSTSYLSVPMNTASVLKRNRYYIELLRRK